MKKSIVFSMLLLTTFLVGAFAEGPIPVRSEAASRLEVRHVGFAGSMGNYSVYVDAKKVATFFGATEYVVIDLQPGPHIVKCFADNQLVTRKSNYHDSIGVEMQAEDRFNISCDEKENLTLEKDAAFDGGVAIQKAKYVDLVSNEGTR
jgi:hypothetical protein